jgi:uncharacterized cupredoxin-like copper-binding protein
MESEMRKTIFGSFLVAMASLAALLVVALPAGATTRTTTVNVVSGKPTEFSYKLSTKTVAMGTVNFKLTDQGILPHDFYVCSSNKGGLANACAGKGTAVIAPGAKATLTIVFKKAGVYEYLCTVPGHAAIGMKGDLRVIAA